MQHDVPFEAEKGHGDAASPFPNYGRPQRRHADRARRRHHQTREREGVPQPRRIDRGEFQQLVIERGAHGRPPASRLGGRRRHGIAVTFRYADIVEMSRIDHSRESLPPG